jgi:hypothetical protein
MRFPAILAFTTMITAAGMANAAPQGDWPCVQPRNPSLSMATFWSGQPIDGKANTTWREDAEVARVVAKVVSRRTSLDDAEKLIVEFAGKLPSEAKAPRLTLVFAGAFHELDTLRTSLVNNIERYTRTQRRVAEELNKDRAELDQLRITPEKNDQQRTRIEELQTKLQWQIRLHKERESTLRYVCETPGLLEQRVFAIARAVQSGM